jgi:hypothetical protein
MNKTKRLKDLYKDHWLKAANDCKYVKATLEKHFPDIDIRPGHGALSSEYESGEHERGSADLFLFKDDKCFLAIEVTGSDRINICNSDMIWLRPDKIEYMKQKKGEFAVVAWLIYRNAECILDLATIEKHQQGKHTHYPRGRGYPETYVHIPFSAGLPTDSIIEFIKNYIEHIHPEPRYFIFNTTDIFEDDEDFKIDFDIDLTSGPDFTDLGEQF